MDLQNETSLAAMCSNDPEKAVGPTCSSSNEKPIPDDHASDTNNADVDESGSITLSRTPTAATARETKLGRTLSLVRTRESMDPGPPPDGGFNAWLQACLAHLVICNTWGYINSFGIFQSYYTTTLNRSPSDSAFSKIRDTLQYQDCATGQHCSPN